MSEQGTKSGATAGLPLGQVIGPYRGYVDADGVLAYARATNDPNPAYEHGVVPPLYSLTLILSALAEANVAVMQAAGIGPPVVHGQHDVYFHAPIVPASVVEWVARPRSLHSTAAGLLLTQQIMVRDLDQRPLVEHLWSTLFVGCTEDVGGGPPLPDHRYPEAARRRPVGAEVIDVDFDQAYRYAGVSNDRAPHALDEQAARAEGFAGKILQGACSFAMCAGAVVRLGAGGDPLALRRLAVRFAAPLHPRQALEVEVTDAGATSGGHRALAFEGRAAGVVCLSHGRAELYGPDVPLRRSEA